MLVAVDDSLLADLADSLKDVAEEGVAAQQELEALQRKRAQEEKVYLQKVASASQLTEQDLEPLFDAFVATHHDVKQAREVLTTYRDPRELVKFAANLLRISRPHREGAAIPFTNTKLASAHRYPESGGLREFGEG